MTSVPPKRITNFASRWLTDELKGYARTGNWESALATVEQIKQSALVELNVFHYSTAIAACSRAGQLEPAMNLFREMKSRNVSPNVYTYTSLITSCGTAGDVDMALRLFAEMRLAKVMPNVQTVTALITACSRAGQWERSVRILQSAARTLDVAPNVRTYTAAIEGCRRAGVCEPAMKLLEEMNDPNDVLPNEVTFNTALGCCVTTKNTEAAQRIYARMVASGYTPMPYTRDLLCATFEGTELEGTADGLAVRSKRERAEMEHLPDVDPVTFTHPIGSAAFITFLILFVVVALGCWEGGHGRRNEKYSLNWAKLIRQKKTAYYIVATYRSPPIYLPLTKCFLANSMEAGQWMGSPRLTAAGIASSRGWQDRSALLRLELYGAAEQESAEATTSSTGLTGGALVVAPSSSHPLPLGAGAKRTRDASEKEAVVDLNSELWRQRREAQGALIATDAARLANKAAPASRAKAPRLPKWSISKILLHQGWVWAAAVDPTNSWFATGGFDSVIKVWDLASGSLMLDLVGHKEAVRSIAMSTTSPYMFSGSDDHAIKCWDLERNEVVREFFGHRSAVHCVSVHPALDVVVSGGRDNTVRVWDIRTRAAVHTLTGHRDSVMSLTTQAVDPQVISGGNDGFIYLWDLAAGKPLTRLTRHKKPVRGLSISPSGAQLVSCGADEIRVWQLPTGEFECNASTIVPPTKGPADPRHAEEELSYLWSSCAMSARGTLAVGSQDGHVAFYDWNQQPERTAPGARRVTPYYRTTTKSIPGTLAGEGGINFLVFDASGTRLLTAESDKSVKEGAMMLTDDCTWGFHSCCTLLVLFLISFSPSSFAIASLDDGPKCRKRKKFRNNAAHLVLLSGGRRQLDLSYYGSGARVSEANILRILVVGNTRVGKTLFIHHMCDSFHGTQRDVRRTTGSSAPTRRHEEWEPTTGLDVHVMARRINTPFYVHPEEESFQDEQHTSTSTTQVVEWYELGASQPFANGCFWTLAHMDLDAVLVLYNGDGETNGRHLLEWFQLVRGSQLVEMESDHLQPDSHGSAAPARLGRLYLIGTVLHPLRGGFASHHQPQEVVDSDTPKGRHTPCGKAVAEEHSGSLSPLRVFRWVGREVLLRGYTGIVRGTRAMQHLMAFALAIILFGPNQQMVDLWPMRLETALELLSQDTQFSGHITKCCLYTAEALNESAGHHLEAILDQLQRDKCTRQVQYGIGDPMMMKILFLLLSTFLKSFLKTLFFYSLVWQPQERKAATALQHRQTWGRLPTKHLSLIFRYGHVGLHLSCLHILWVSSCCSIFDSFAWLV
eukprot:gene11026-7662_t